MPDFPIIDSHVHLYDIARLSYPWLAGVPQINRTYLLPDFDAARGPVQVDRIVFAEVAVAPGQHIAEAEFVQELADADARLAAMIAHAPVEKGAAVEEDLAALSRFPTLRGIRRLIEVERDPGICLEPGFLEGVRRVGRHGLTFDICVKSWGMGHALELARRCPDVSFVLDHIGKPDIRHGLREPWWTQIAELARLPNVVVKLSGVITEADHAAWTREQVIPYVAHVIECFGFDRVMYGSDWTVAELTHRYPTWVEILDQIVAGSSEAEQRALYRGTAARTYRLADSSFENKNPEVHEISFDYYCRLEDNGVWEDIDNIARKRGMLGGVYRMHALDVSDDPNAMLKYLPVPRACGTDRHGILYIGKAEVYAGRKSGRFIDLRKTLRSDYEGSPHHVGEKFLQLRAMRKKYPKIGFTLSFSTTPLADESRELQNYVDSFGELPPLNQRL